MLLVMTQLPTPPIQPPSRSERGRTLRLARADRARTIRRVVISGALALFVAAWLLIAIVLVSGHDPALAARAVTTGTRSASSSPATTSVAPASTASTTSASTVSAQSASANTGAGAVTTRQS
jgi:hypothetical protein